MEISMKKKIICALLIICSLTFLLSGCGENVGLGTGEIKYKTENGGLTVKELPTSSTAEEIVIPDEVDGVPVTKIADFAGVNLESAKKITIGKNVKEIGPWAFENNQNLTEFIVSEENPYFCDIDGVLFSKDKKVLLFYPLSKGLTEKAEKDESGKKVTVKSIEYAVPEGTEIISTKAFYKCGNLTALTIPQSVKRIEEKAFFRCSALKEVKLPENLEFIGKDGFSYCSALTEIVIPASVKKIDEYAFYNCGALVNVKVNNKEENLKLGKKWYPTNNGLDIDELKITYAG